MSDYYPAAEDVLPLFTKVQPNCKSIVSDADHPRLQSRCARNHHENIDNQKHVLAELRSGLRLTRTEWEGRDECKGKRLAPVICKLRIDFGLEILGHGKKADPYYMPNARAMPTKAQVSDDMKQAYYKTQHWLSTRQQRISSDFFRCVLCGSLENIVCHHITYKRLFMEYMSDLMTVCESCHEEIHESCSMKFPGGISVKYATQLGWKGPPAWVLP
jgi:5-methylcytosine-specific restriction endonuclease McrA